MKSSKCSKTHRMPPLFLAAFILFAAIGRDSVLVTAASPADQINQACNANIYCLPTAGEVWGQQQNYFVQWNYNYPTFATTGRVNIRLFNNQSTTPVYQLPSYENAEGLLIINTIQSSWFLGNQTVQYFYFLITGSEDPPSIAENGPIFLIQSPPPTSTSSTATATATATPTRTPTSTPLASATTTPGHSGPNNDESSGLSVGAICGIAVGSVLFVTTIACLIYFIRRKRGGHKQGYDFQLESESGSGVNGYAALGPTNLGTARDNTSNSDADSTLPMTESLSPGKRSSLCLTVKDAQELAHAYRKMLTNKDATEETPQTTQQRSLYSDELLRRELAADGHGVKNVSTTPAIVVVDDQVNGHGMTADPSEPDSTTP
ncbi:hypothetical protein K493DRAFT_73732 [Basidiobolus meristosporus CBS 931.73]|uniref:Mid2 domain-containing protein n=1 Tax=Basidiobolus meristosporus CBS 931.73 TaxID=1314790 RepID=A0A1Y1XTN9_9FUNG|nr:hypothetical protein K493DRAFT_73732 [Basidiobolus meristosporus CBS 931.73]|eukprot:ORX88866.1 hypothetical protein K493DRAFT_73732 [Basidiobolus meristosporus CBS 931.73]